MSPASSPPDLRELLDLAADLARRAGDLLLEGVPRRRSGVVSTKTSSTDMVSEMDRASEELIVRGVVDARPEDGIVAEEGGDREGSTGVRWLIDPLDGTTNYLYGHPAWSVSIAAELGGEMVVAAVADPPHSELFTAVRGGGARCNDAPIVPSGHDDLATALVGTGFSYLPERRAQQAEVLTRVLPAVRDVRRFGAASLDLCWVACGRLDAYYEATLQPWDVAAGGLIAKEAGAVSRGPDEGPPTAEFAMAATPTLAGPLWELLRSAGVVPG